jgi:hypothetical protein
MFDVARRAIGRYGTHSAALMEARSKNCRRHGELASANFWHRVAEAVRQIEAVAFDRDLHLS